MAQQILVIHGGNAFLKYEDYLAYLETKNISLEKLLSKDWKLNLQSDLGPEHQVIAPRMPNGDNARYSEWKLWFERLLPLLDQDLILVGHSLGGIFLAKYLSENNCGKNIKATFLIAAPYNTADNPHQIVDFVLPDGLSLLASQGGRIHIYQSEDDMVVPVKDAHSYAAALPAAELTLFTDRQHFNQSDLAELITAIKAVK